MENDESDLVWVAAGDDVGDCLGLAESEGLVVVTVSICDCGEEAGISSGDVEPLVEFLLEEFCSSLHQGAFNIL